MTGGNASSVEGKVRHSEESETTARAQYGQYVRFSDIVANQAIDDLRAETTDNLGEAMGNSYDQLTRGVYNAGSTVSFTN